MTTAISTDKQSNFLKSTSSSFNAADLPEEARAQLSKTMPRAFESAVKKRVVEPIFALQSKKLKGDSLVQTLDQMNGIMSVCGVNMAEEEIGMLPKLTEQRRSLVQKELFLEKKPLQDKLIKLANNWGVSFVNEDVELCLSLSLEELFRSIFIRLIRYSDQSQDMVKGNAKLLVTSDVGAQICMLRQKAREALKAKELAAQKRAENLYNENKAQKNKKAAKENLTKVIALQTVETDEMLIKWEIMAEQARLKRENKAGTLGKATKSEVAGTSSADSGRPPGTLGKATLAGTSSADSGRPAGLFLLG